MNSKFLSYLSVALLISIFGLTQATAAQLNINVEGDSGEIQIENTGDVCNTLTTPCLLQVDNTQSIKISASENSESYVSSWGNICTQGTEPQWANELVYMVEPLDFLVNKISVADLNGNGQLDLAMLDMRGGGDSNTRFTVSFNLGGGNYSIPELEYETLSFLSDIKTVDWDKDGDMDVLLVDYDAIVIHLYTNNGLGDFSYEKHLSLPNVNAISVAIADINNDGAYDILAGSSDGVRMAWPNNLRVIIPAFHNGDVSWFVNDGNDNFSHHYQISTHRGTYSVDVDDYDGDGDLDIVSASRKEKSFFLYTNEISGYSTEKIGEEVLAYNIAFGDFNNNGLKDIVASTTLSLPNEGAVFVSLQQENNSFNTLERVYQYSGYAQALDTADMDNDGDQDIITGVFAGNRHYSWLENQGNQQCIIDNTGTEEINVTVTFSEIPRVAVVEDVPINDSIAVEDAPAPDSLVESDSNESGGTITFGMLLLGLLLTLRRKG